MKKGIHPALAAVLVVIALGLVFGVMYALSEAPTSDKMGGPNFGAGAPAGGGKGNANKGSTKPAGAKTAASTKTGTPAKPGTEKPAR